MGVRGELFTEEGGCMAQMFVVPMADTVLLHGKADAAVDLNRCVIM